MSGWATNESEEHDRIVALTAQIRLAYPDSNHPNWKTYTNHPDQKMGVTKRDGTTVYPDIVVLETPNNYLKIISEVETAMTVTDDEATREWASYASIGTTFYLYVPRASVATARDLLARHSIVIAGLRGYDYDGSGNLKINDY